MIQFRGTAVFLKTHLELAIHRGFAQNHVAKQFVVGNNTSRFRKKRNVWFYNGSGFTSGQDGTLGSPSHYVLDLRSPEFTKVYVNAFFKGGVPNFRWVER